MGTFMRTVIVAVRVIVMLVVMVGVCHATASVPPHYRLNGRATRHRPNRRRAVGGSVDGNYAGDAAAATASAVVSIEEQSTLMSVSSM
jgi:hypothetical protein